MKYAAVAFLAISACSEPPNETMNFIVHQPPSEGLDVIFEYPLPVSEAGLRAEHKRLLTDWTIRFLNKDESAVANQLKDDWVKLNQPVVRRFTNYLATLRPSCLSFCGDRAWLTVSGSPRAHKLMLRPPRELSEDEQRFLASFDAPGLDTFASHFYDLFEWGSPYESGIVMDLAPLSDQHLPRIGSWRGSICLYYVSNGDLLLLNREGRVAQWRHDAGWGDEARNRGDLPIVVRFDSFAEFVDNYIGYLNGTAPFIDDLPSHE